MSVERLYERTRQDNVLTAVLLELTYGCNLDCTFCYNDLALRGERLSLDDYRALLDELAGMQVMSVGLSGGEPLVYRHFFELGAHARRAGFMVRIKSNGVPINRRNAERLREEVDPYLIEISLHGADAPTHDALTRVPGSFERLLRNIGVMRELGLRLRFNAPLTRLNEGQVAAMFALADALGVPLRFDPEITPRDDGDASPLDLQPSREGVAEMFRLSLQRGRAAGNAGWQALPVHVRAAPGAAPDRAGPRKICGTGSTSVTIDPFGNVYPCVQFRRRIGNLHRQSIAEIWSSSAELREVRELAVRARDVAAAEGVGHYCMGSAALQTGDPLKIHAGARVTAEIFRRVEWEQASRAVTETA